MSNFFRVLVFSLILGLLSSCVASYESRVYAYKTVKMRTTGYCPCQKCCSWEYTWYFMPVYKKGPLKGKYKKVGYCADGTKAHYGVIAADTRYYPIGTIMYIKGYGYGVVHDRGGAIKGDHIDLYFPTHEQALKWGSKTKYVKLCRKKK
jgi:3D (Asp-Asp-Asp) domain-containing protein